MLIIRKAQREAFVEQAWTDFEGRMVSHVREFFPVDHARLGEPPLRKVIRHGIARARAHGISVFGDACRYIDLMLALGSDFDRDPQLPWAGDILAREGDRRLIMAELDAHALGHMQRIAGADGGPYVHALMRVRGAPYEDFTAAAQDLDAFLSRLHPAKYRELEAVQAVPAFHSFLEEASAESGLHRAGARALYATLMFLLGSRFATDPLWPWAGAALADSSREDGEPRARALLAAAAAHLEQALTLIRAETVGGRAETVNGEPRP